MDRNGPHSQTNNVGESNGEGPVVEQNGAYTEITEDRNCFGLPGKQMAVVVFDENAVSIASTGIDRQQREKRSRRPKKALSGSPAKSKIGFCASVEKPMTRKDKDE
mmetsp:Transcript_20772/g.49119  ORF Transcript_20772/g.49119 Transcript_20772/m.49119 type:complete len:106 (-) Transcript_20772:503-820(-)